MTALRTVLWPMSVAKLTATVASRMRSNASPTASADDPQLPATMDVTPMRMKFSACGRDGQVVRVRVHVDEPGRDDEPARVERARASAPPARSPIAAIRPSLIAMSVGTGRRARAVDDAGVRR